MGKRVYGAVVLVFAMVLAASIGQFQLMAQQPSPQPATRPAQIGGHPNFNGVWQALNSATWNLEAHSASGISQAWQIGAIASVPPGKSVIKGGGTIPYTPEALKQRDENRAKWPENDNEAKCYMLGIPRYTYHNLPFHISQGDVDIQMVYPFAAGNRFIYMKESEHGPDPVDSWMGRSNGHWEGEVLVIVTTDLLPDARLDRAGNFHSNKLKVTERFRLIDATHIQYEATLEDPLTYTRPWTIEMPLYRLIEDNAQALEYKCVPFADMLLYHDLIGDKPKP